MLRLAVAPHRPGSLMGRDTRAGSTPLKVGGSPVGPAYVPASVTAGASAVSATSPSPLPSIAPSVTLRVPPAPFRSPFIPRKYVDSPSVREPEPGSPVRVLTWA